MRVWSNMSSRLHFYLVCAALFISLFFCRVTEIHIYEIWSRKWDFWDRALLLLHIEHKTTQTKEAHWELNSLRASSFTRNRARKPTFGISQSGAFNNNFLFPRFLSFSVLIWSHRRLLKSIFISRLEVLELSLALRSNLRIYFLFIPYFFFFG